MRYAALSFVFVLSVFFLAPSFSLAQTKTIALPSAFAPAPTRSYHYEAISETFTVRQNSIVDVEEAQTFNYVGAYHQGRRWIPLRNVRWIDNVAVIDGATGVALTYVPKQLNKDDPASWGKYTYYIENNMLRIEWYYDLHDTSHRFVFHYRVHGAVDFYNNYDGLYWDLVTDYGVPIDHLEAKVILPALVPSSKLSGILYGSAIDPLRAETAVLGNNGTIAFAHNNVIPHETITIATRWPKKVVGYMSYIQDYFFSRWGR